MTAARHVGTPEYKELQTARRDYPGFTVTTITRKVNTQCETYKGLTYAYMERYIEAHDDEVIARRANARRGNLPVLRIPFIQRCKEQKRRTGRLPRALRPSQ